MSKISTKKCALALAITASLSGHVIANDEAIDRQSTAKASEEVVQKVPEKITVTGSRLKRDSFPNP